MGRWNRFEQGGLPLAPQECQGPTLAPQGSQGPTLARQGSQGSSLAPQGSKGFPSAGPGSSKLRLGRGGPLHRPGWGITFLDSVYFFFEEKKFLFPQI